MDILVLLFVVILLVIDSNVRKRVFTALAAAVNLRHPPDGQAGSVDTDNDTHDTSNDMRDKDSDTDDTRDDMHVTRDDTAKDTLVTSDDTDVASNDMHDIANDMHVTDNVTVSHDAIDAVSRLVAADVISATRACQLAFGVSQRGNAAIYRAVRARAAEIKQMSQMSQKDEIVDIRRDGRVIRCDTDGRYYVIYANGRKEYIEEKEITA